MNNTLLYKKCITNFTSQFAYINNKYLHVNKYKKEKCDNILCKNGHELILCEGDKIKKYFRHKNKSDVCGNPMTEWHSRIQSYFPITEIEFKKKCQNQLKDRRADVVINNHNYIIEIQHSYIDDANVLCRYNDYLLHNMNLIWFIDGNTNDIILDELSNGTYLITFEKNWKYKSFMYKYEFILLDINNKIFKIPVKKVCNKMILLKEYKSIDYIIEKLNNNPEKIWDEWDDDNEIKATLTVKQKGAGNGKTYGIWESISNNKDKEVFIIVTKQHSAKFVIFRELNEQAKREEYHIINNMDDIDKEEKSRKYIVNYKHKHSNRECVVIIGTIDSLIFNLCDNKYSNSDFFEGLLKTVKDYGITKVNKSKGSFKYAGKSLNLNKKTELWIDEAQDLKRSYFISIIKLILETKIDIVIVGDKLQSLEYKINFMTCIEDSIPNINVIQERAVNTNRRINVDKMADEINNLIKFNKYNLPNININKPNELIKRNDAIIEIINTPVIYAGDNVGENKKNIENYVDLIIEKVNYEREKYNYLPKDFLFVFPIMKSNLIASELETKLNKYWIDIMQDSEEYKNYAILHKHEEGQIIDTSLSDNASRIVSIRTSKGDGRKVVFVLGCTEMSLKLVSGSDEIDLIYESYLHVALTRAKEKIYFGLVRNNDEIHNRFSREGLVEYMPKINHNIMHHKLIQYINKEKVIELLKSNGIKEIIEPEPDSSKIKPVIDWEYHCIRRAIYLQYAIFNIFDKNKNNNNFKKSQLKVILDKISKLDIQKKSPYKFYNYLNSLDKLKEIEYLPLCKLSHKTIYKSYIGKIKSYIKNIIKKYNNNNLSIKNHNPVEAVLQWYIIELFRNKKYCETSPITIYNIIDNFEKEDNTKLTELLRESELIKDTTTKALIEILNTDEYIKWNIEHIIRIGNEFSEFNIMNRNIPIIGFSNSVVYHLIFQTDYNKLNFWDTMIKIMIERFIIYNTGDKGKDVEKFKGKKIITYLFILKQNDYKTYNWDWDNNDNFSLEFKNMVKNAIVKYFSTFNTQLFNYCLFIKKSDLWKDCQSPYDYIAKRYKNFIGDFFKNLHERSKINKATVKKITDNKNEFCKEITKKIIEVCNNFFKFEKKIDNEEW